MKADPTTCKHVLTCDDVTGLVYCTECDYWWDADSTESEAIPSTIQPTIQSTNASHEVIHITQDDYPADWSTLENRNE
jgi:hypothetical protein